MTNNSNVDNDYLSMLNNPVINPPRQQTAPTQTPQTAFIAQQAKTLSDLPAAQRCQDKLLGHIKDLYLVSETDTPWYNVAVSWQSAELPNSYEDLEQAGLLVRNSELERYENRNDDGEFQTTTVDAFFEPLVKSNQQQSDQYASLLHDIKSIFGDNVKVYLIGTRVITVIILGLIEDKGEKVLVGLQSEQVET